METFVRDDFGFRQGKNARKEGVCSCKWPIEQSLPRE